MVDLKAIAGYTAIPLAVVLVASLFAGIEPSPTHYCESKQVKAYCFSTTATRCYSNPTKTSWTTCSGGWKEIPKESNIQDTITSAQYLCPPGGPCYKKS